MSTNDTGHALANALGLNPNDITSITITPTDYGDGLIVDVHGNYYLDTDDPRFDTIIDIIKQYRLVPITNNDITPLEPPITNNDITPLESPPTSTAKPSTSHFGVAWH